MNDTWVTVVGNLTAEPAWRTTGGGVPLATLRVATTPRRFDGAAGEWKDGETTFLSVSCWRALAEHVCRSLHKGDPVVVHGRLVLRTYETAQGERRTSTEVAATVVGHDLSRGTAAFARAGRTRPVEAPRGVPAPVPSPRWEDEEPRHEDAPALSDEAWEAEADVDLEEPLPTGV